MKRYFLWSSLVLFLLLTACAVQPPLKRPLLQPPERLTLENFSFLPLDEPAWYRSSQTANPLLLGKDGDHPDETKIIRVDVISNLPATESDEAFISYIQSWVESVKNDRRTESKDKRYKFQEVKLTRVEFQGRPCLQSFSVNEDRKATKRTNNPASMVLKIFSIQCKHPAKKTAISLGYSERVYAGHEDPAFQEKALRLFNGLQFLP